MYLGLDLGTSELKALLLADDHRIVGVANAKLTVSRPQPLWSEQAPAQWWAALEDVMRQLRARHAGALGAVRAIGLSGQMHGAVLLDEHDAVLRPAILWNDGRSAAQCEALAKEVPGLAAIAGNLAMPGFTAPKLLWVREHEPALFARTHRVLLPKDWLRLMLSGEAVSDMSDASGTLWLDVGRRDWSDGRGFVSLGTSGVIFVSGAAFAPNPSQAVHAFCHALPGRWHQMSVMLSAASAVSWAVRAFGFADEAALLAAAATLGPDARVQAPLFSPCLSGERSPHNDAQAQGALVGLTHAHGPADIAWAVVEGVSFGLRDGLDTLARPVGDLALVGGGARSLWWAQLLADVLEVPLALGEGGEAGGALGAARLGWLADGGTVESVCRPPPVKRRFVPDGAQAGAHRARHARFRALYPALKPLRPPAPVLNGSGPRTAA
ncbi:MAG: xylulokinase [Variovorax sp.]|nr:MAG: xylulokinase [Variovorax sp.]